MKKSLLFILILGVIISCSKEPQNKDLSENSAISQSTSLELVDIRIYENGELKINGASLSESSLESHLDSLPIDKETRVRVSSSDQVYTGLVNRISKELAIRDIKKVRFSMLSSEEFDRLENNMIIDVLNNGQIMMDGFLLYPEDLAIALRENEYPQDLTVILNVGEDVKMGPITDVQKILKASEVYRIEYSTTKS